MFEQEDIVRIVQRRTEYEDATLVVFRKDRQISHYWSDTNGLEIMDVTFIPERV